MKKTTSSTILFLFLLTVNFVHAQNVGNPPAWNWAQSIGGSALDYSADIVADGNGNAYVAGVFNGSIKIGNNQWQSVGQNNGFLAKFAPDGALLWARQFKSNNNDGEVFCQTVSLDNSGNVIVTGNFRYGSLVIENTVKPIAGVTDIFVAKFSASGMTASVGTYGAFSASILANKAAIDDNGNVYCLSSGAIIKFDQAGNFVWVQLNPLSSNGGDIVWANGKLFLGGSFYQDVEINNTIVTSANEAILMCEVDPLFGDFSNPVKLFESSYVIPGYLTLKSLIVKGPEEIYAAGQSIDTLSSSGCVTAESSFLSKGFISKTGASGCKWVLVESTTSGLSIINDIALDANGNLYAGGDRNTSAINFGGFSLPEGLEGFQVKIKAADGTVLDLKDKPLIIGLSSDASNNVYAASVVGFGATLEKSNTMGASVYATAFENDGGSSTVSSVESDGTGIYVMSSVFGKVKYGNAVLDVPQSSMLIAKVSLDGAQILWHKLVEGVSGVYRTEGGTVSYLDKTYGKFYTAGVFSNTFTYNGQTYTNPNPSGTSYFVTQTGTDGNPGWLKILPGVEYLSNITTDNAGNLIVCGSFLNTVTFGSITLTGKGEEDFFITKLDKDGNVLWAKRGGGDNVEFGVMASTDAQNNIYFAAETYSLQLDFNDTWSLVTEEGDGNIMLGKLSPDGDVVWIQIHGKSTTHEANCFPFAIKTDAIGNTFLSGFYGKTSSFSNITITSPYNFNNFVAKFNPNGDAVWVTPIKTKRFVINYNEMDIDELGGVYIAGQIRDSTFIENNIFTIQGNPIARNSYIARFDGLNGSLDWCKTTAGSPDCILVPTAMSVKDHNSILCGGTFQDRAAFDNFNLNSNSSNGGYLGLLGSAIMVAVHTPVAGKTMLEISPNPAVGYTTLTTHEGIQDPVKVSIVANNGSLVLEQEFKGMAAAQNIDVSQLAPGVYFLTVAFGDVVETKRLVIGQ